MHDITLLNPLGLALDFFSLKGPIKTDKPFTIEAMEKAIEDAVLIKYGKKT